MFNIGVSIGLIEIGREAGTVEQLLAAADSACYVAKKEGAGRVSVYSARDEALARNSGDIEWLQKLQGAIKEERFALYYQPIVAAYGGETDGPSMEVLLRMVDEAGAGDSTGGIRAGGRTLPPHGVGGPLGGADHVDRACRATHSSWRAIAAWPSTSPARRSAIRNSSNSWSSAWTAPAWRPSRCVSRSPRAPSSTISSTHAVSSVYCTAWAASSPSTISVPGVGSFSSLKTLELDYLKLDGSFMRNLARDSVSQTMVTAMIKLARTLNFKIIAEQVEDNAALDAARSMGVDYVQGFVIARPARLATAA